MNNKFIPEKLYREFLKVMPLCCVDLVVKNKKSFLLIERKNDPLKGYWWFPGGRVFFGEKLISAVKRKLKEEINVKKISKIKFLGIEETKFKKGYFGSPVFTINIIFLVEIDDNQAKNIKADVNHKGFKWLDKIPKNSNWYLKKFLKLSKFN